MGSPVDIPGNFFYNKFKEFPFWGLFRLSSEIECAYGLIKTDLTNSYPFAIYVNFHHVSGIFSAWQGGNFSRKINT